MKSKIISDQSSLSSNRGSHSKGQTKQSVGQPLDMETMYIGGTRKEVQLTQSLNGKASKFFQVIWFSKVFR